MLPSWRGSALLLVVVSQLSAMCCTADQMCCETKRKLREARELAAQETIPDPADTPPADLLRQIKDPAAQMPEDWDEEFDGPWGAPMVDNPEFLAWKPRMMPNPQYKPPNKLLEVYDDVVAEVMAATPWVTLGIVLTALLTAGKLPQLSLKSKLQGTTSLQDCAKGAFIGLITPLCSCGALPMARGFIEDGAPMGVVVAFLTASQSAGLDSAAITWGLLGPAAAMWRLGGAVVLAVAAGLSAPATAKGAGTKDAGSSKRTEDKVAGTAQAAASTGVLAVGKRVASSAIDTCADVLPMVMVGLIVSTGLRHLLPPLDQATGSIQSTLGEWAYIGPFLGRLAVLVSALPLQLCEHTTVTLAAGIQKSGGSPGLAFAFLLSAPATNLATILMLVKSQQSDPNASVKGNGMAVARVTVALTLTALALSYAIDAAGVDMLVAQEAELGGSGSVFVLPGWYRSNSHWLAGTLVALAAGKRISKYATTPAVKTKTN